MKTGEIITAAELVDIIGQHGAGTYSIDGSMPERFESAADLQLEEEDRFAAVINYSHEVQFHLVGDDVRAIVTTGLKGRCKNMEWAA